MDQKSIFIARWLFAHIQSVGSDARSCQDIDECETEKVCHGLNEICTNTRGSYRCTQRNCPPDYITDPAQKK